MKARQETEMQKSLQNMMVGMAEMIGKTIESSLSKTIESSLSKLNPSSQTAPHETAGDTASEQGQNAPPHEKTQAAEGLGSYRVGLSSHGSSNPPPQTMERDVKMIWNTLNILGLVQTETVVSPEPMPNRDQTTSQNIKNSAMSQAKTKTTEIGRPATGHKRDQQHIGPTEVTQKRPKTQATASRTKGQGHKVQATPEHPGDASPDTPPNRTPNHQ